MLKRAGLAFVLAVIFTLSIGTMAMADHGLGDPISDELGGEVDVRDVADNVYRYRMAGEEPEGEWFETISGALTGAEPGDSILVTSTGSPYEEAVTIEDDNITLKAAELTEEGDRGSTDISDDHFDDLDATVEGEGTVKIADEALDADDKGTLIEVRAENVTIAGFVLKDAQRRAVWLTSDADGATIEKSKITSIGVLENGEGPHGSPYGIYVDQSQPDTEIRNNHIIDNVGDGIGTFEGSDFLIDNNLIQNNERHGIRLVRGTNLTITNNVIKGNGLPIGQIDASPHFRSGIYIVSDLTDPGHTITGNDILDQHLFGVAIGYDHHSTLDDTRLFAQVEGADRNLYDNTFRGNNVHVMQVNTVEDDNGETLYPNLNVLKYNDFPLAAVVTEAQARTYGSGGTQDVPVGTIEDVQTATDIVEPLGWGNNGTDTFDVDQYEEFDMTINAGLNDNAAMNFLSGEHDYDEQKIVAVDRVLWVIEIEGGTTETDNPEENDVVFEVPEAYDELGFEVRHHEDNIWYYSGPGDKDGYAWHDMIEPADYTFKTTFNVSGTFDVTIQAVRADRE